MDNPQDCLVTSSQDFIKKTEPSTSGHSVSVYQHRNGRKKKIKGRTEQFPWFLSFQKVCCSILGSKSLNDLLSVITQYTELVTSEVVASYSKPNRAAKLKTNMMTVLAFFHNCYETMKEPFDDAAYFEKMSNLLTMYFDMEVKASRRGKESVKRIISKLISALFLFLNNSPEYILDTLLKARFTVKSYSEICIPIFKKVTDLPQSQEMNYVRSLLVFKLWKRMLTCREERNSVNRLAVAKLSPPPAQVLEFIKRGLLANVLPHPPEEDRKAALITRFYMTKKFNLREAIKAFLKMEAKLKLNDFTSILDHIKFSQDEEDEVPVENNFEKDYSLLESIWIDISNSPETPDHSSLSSLATSGCLPLNISFNGSSNHMLDSTKKTALKKLKKSPFKPSAKKTKQAKTKNKKKVKKMKEDLVIDLCIENEDNCCDNIQNTLQNSKSHSDARSKPHISERVSPSSTAVGEHDTSLKSNDSFPSESVPEVISKFSSKPVVKNLVETILKVESKLNIENNSSSEPSKSKKFINNIQLQQLEDLPSPPKSGRDHSTKRLSGATIASKTVQEIDKREIFEINSKLFENPLEKSKLNKEPQEKSENNIALIETDVKEIKAVPQEMEEIKTVPKKESNLITASTEVPEEMQPVNKIVISCKNFSKIGFKHDMEEKLTNTLNEQPGELISSIEINEDPILKLENIKEDSLLFKENGMPPAELSFDQLEHKLDTNNLSWDNILKDNSQEINLSTEEESTKKLCSEDFSNTRFNLTPEKSLNVKSSSFEHLLNNKNSTLNNRDNKTNRITENDSSNTRLNSNTKNTNNSKSDSFDNCFHGEITNLHNIEGNKQSGEPNKQVITHVPIISKEGLIDKIGGKIHNVYHHLEAKSSKLASPNNTLRDKSENVDFFVNPPSKSQGETPEASKIPLDITEKSNLKSGPKIIHKSISTIIHELKEGESSTSSDNSNQESSEVSSSSFEDSYPMNIFSSPTLKTNSNDENQESRTCKVENGHFKELSACMRNSEYSLLNSQLKEKCDKNIQVPFENTGYKTNKSDFLARVQSSSIPKNANFKKQAFNLHKGLNTCLLHKILGEEDCLKSGCLLKSSGTEKSPQELNKTRLTDVSLKQELESSSELPTENLTPTIPSLWNPIAGIKVENESSRSSECIEGIRSTSSEFLIRSVTEACNFKELDYNIGSGCDNLPSNYDCESDCEDRNLVIDEDIDSAKDQNETEDILLKDRSECVKNDASKRTISPVILNNNKRSKTLDQQLWVNNIPCEMPIVTMEQQKHQPGKNELQIKENDSVKKEQAGKHKLPRILESNIKTPSHRNSYVNESSLDSSIKFRTRTKNELLFTAAENSPSYVSAQQYGADISNTVPKHYPHSNIIKRSDVTVNIGQISPGPGVFSPYPMPHNQNVGNDLNVIRTKNRDPRLRSGNFNNYHLKSNVNVQASVNIQPTQGKPLENVNAVNKPVLPSEIAKSASPRPVSSPSRYETYAQFNKVSTPSNQTLPTIGSPVERYCQRNSPGNEKYRSLEKVCHKRDSPLAKFQENSNTTYAEGNNMKDNSNQPFHEYGATDPQNIKPGDTLYDEINSTRDPLCLVKSKEDLREMYDFEFNVFPIAQEIEICSGSENLGGEWLYPISSEIGHPDWPIANEQNVIDSSGYTQTQDQYMYSMLNSDEGCPVSEPDQMSYTHIELQQIDNRHPNIAGKHINKEKLNLHLRTLEGDHNLCCSQCEFKEFYLSRDVPPTIPVPFPPQGRSDSMNATVRCPCEQCSDNYQKLLSNYNLLTHFRNSKIKPLGVFPKSDEATFSDKDLNGESGSTLPLKKRKTLTNSKATEDLVLPSYPNTPMISIAQLELTGYEQGNQVIVPNPQSQWRESVAYNPLNLVQPSSVDQFDGQAKGKRKASKRRKSSR